MILKYNTIICYFLYCHWKVLVQIAPKTMAATKIAATMPPPSATASNVKAATPTAGGSLTTLKSVAAWQRECPWLQRTKCSAGSVCCAILCGLTFSLGLSRRRPGVQEDSAARRGMPAAWCAHQEGNAEGASVAAGSRWGGAALKRWCCSDSRVIHTRLPCCNCSYRGWHWQTGISSEETPTTLWAPQEEGVEQRQEVVEGEEFGGRRWQFWGCSCCHNNMSA